MSRTYIRRMKRILAESHRLSDDFLLQKENKILNKGISVGIKLQRELIYKEFPEFPKPHNEIMQEGIECYHCKEIFVLNKFRYRTAKTLSCFHCGKRIIKSKCAIKEVWGKKE